MENLRKDIRCEHTSAERFVSDLGKMAGCELKDFRPANDRCHQVVYKYLLSGEKLSVVFDTKAGILTLTASERIFECLDKLLKTVGASAQAAKRQPDKDSVSDKSGAEKGRAISLNKDARNAVPDKTDIKALKPHGESVAMLNTKPAEQKSNKANTGQSARSRSKTDSVNKSAAADVTSADKADGKHSAEKRHDNDAANKSVKSAFAEKNAAEKSAVKKGAAGKATKQPPAAGAEKSSDAAGKADALSGAADFTVKNVTSQRFESVLSGLRKIRGMKLRQKKTAGSGKDSVVAYTILDNKGNKANLRYMPSSGVIQLQGKRSSLFGDIQVQLSRGDDYNSAVKNYIAIAGEDKSAGSLQKMLRKRLPDAYEFLSEQSKIDITIGLIDIYNNETKLTDYSSLLTPPYRGLEKFISDLQKAQGIEVKMIGQAFDKPEGRYELKSGYKKRIKSVIYAEVMSALYTEYFSRRNFYTHSDNSDESAPRMISDKKEAVAIFDHLLDTINYNCKKLKEIGFGIK